MRNRFDYGSKEIGSKALGSSGTTFVNDAINPETQYADLRHEPDPTRQAERAQLGLLGRLAACACLIEVYSQAPSAEEFRACLSKHLASWQRRTRKARSDGKDRGDLDPQDAIDPFLWIIAAGSPTTLRVGLKLEHTGAWPAGVYLFGGDILRVGLVVASELPRDPTTLLVRLMAGGPLIAQATREVAALPPDAPVRVIAEPVLLQLQQVLGEQPSHTPDEQEFILAMLKTWEEGRAQARAEGHAEGHAEGRAEGEARALLTLLHGRGITVPDAVREQILAEQDLRRLERWVDRASRAISLDEVLDDPS